MFSYRSHSMRTLKAWFSQMLAAASALQLARAPGDRPPMTPLDRSRESRGYLLVAQQAQSTLEIFAEVNTESGDPIAQLGLEAIVGIPPVLFEDFRDNLFDFAPGAKSKLFLFEGTSGLPEELLDYRTIVRMQDAGEGLYEVRLEDLPRPIRQDAALQGCRDAKVSWANVGSYARIIAIATAFVATGPAAGAFAGTSSANALAVMTGFVPAFAGKAIPWVFGAALTAIGIWGEFYGPNASQITPCAMIGLSAEAAFAAPVSVEVAVTSSDRPWLPVGNNPDIGFDTSDQVQFFRLEDLIDGRHVIDIPLVLPDLLSVALVQETEGLLSEGDQAVLVATAAGGTPSGGSPAYEFFDWEVFGGFLDGTEYREDKSVATVFVGEDNIGATVTVRDRNGNVAFGDWDATVVASSFPFRGEFLLQSLPGFAEAARYVTTNEITITLRPNASDPERTSLNGTFEFAVDIPGPALYAAIVIAAEGVGAGVGGFGAVFGVNPDELEERGIDVPPEYEGCVLRVKVSGMLDAEGSEGQFGGQGIADNRVSAEGCEGIGVDAAALEALSERSFPLWEMTVEGDVLRGSIEPPNDLLTGDLSWPFEAR